MKTTRWVLGMLVSAVLLQMMVHAQATPTAKMAWDEAGFDLATVQAYTYKYYADGSTMGATLTGVTCTGTASPFQCSVAFPAFTPGPHTLTLSGTNAAGEGAPSAPFAFVFVVVPAAPANVRIQ